MKTVLSRFRTPAGTLTLALTINTFLSILKIGWGHSIHSAGMIADGYHALLDSVSDLICLVGVSMANRPPDENHPYGHGKFEPLAQVAVSVFLFLTGYEVLSHSWESFRGGQVVLFTLPSLLVMLVSMGLQLFLVRFERRVGETTGNSLVKADALHIRSDLFASVAVVAGLLASHWGYPRVDPVVGFLIAVLIAHAGYELLREGTQVLSDKRLMDPEDIIRIASSVEGVMECHSVRSRGSDSQIYMDLNIHVDDSLTVAEAHAISHEVEEAIRRHHPAVAEVIVHIEPFREEHLHGKSVRATH
ncbi:cation diffusion facilitator family transporter [Leptospirillum ferriphilum]|jgi:cation diffusion facilitator family transporter|uniref:Cobalt-zinc-cadmium resistance protein n=2 Tax=Leptospirillum TaxID=179 RepID=A0A094W6M0_9BACT|nr:cation diffusion facilitator family transporter [Leptospirillum ferriphilum]EDZ38564.1 MAG: Cation efflux system protein [Leptospirillum sp. Group II '5-way CG']KGA93088.1 Cobalt-zinc-cadmium resistance protein [Leptospirillum ferriphilum]